MDKYGVTLDPDKTKTAEESNNTKPMCPLCKRELDSVSPPHCPEHGTLPFEPEPKDR